MKRFEASLNAAAGKPVIDGDVADAKALGVTGTPAFFINGRFLSGAKPFAEFAQLINGELTRMNLAIPAGAAGAAPAPRGRGGGNSPAPPPRPRAFPPRGRGGGGNPPRRAAGGGGGWGTP